MDRGAWQRVRCDWATKHSIAQHSKECFWIMVLEESWDLGLQGDQIRRFSLEGLLLKLRLQYFGHLIRRADSLEMILMLGKTEGKRRRRQQRMRWLHSITDSMDMNLGKLREILEDRGAWCAAVHGVTDSWTRRKVGKACNLLHPK